MSAKTYFIQFGSGNPQKYSGLSPTFTLFQGPTGVTMSAAGLTFFAGFTSLVSPTIFEIGLSIGIYSFGYDPVNNPLGITVPIVFCADGGATLIDADRFRCAAMDPVVSMDQRLGYPGDYIGSTLIDPSTIFGYQGRNLEFEEGTATFNKQTGAWTIMNRGGSIILRVRTLVNTSATAMKT